MKPVQFWDWTEIKIDLPLEDETRRLMTGVGLVSSLFIISTAVPFAAPLIPILYYY